MNDLFQPDLGDEKQALISKWKDKPREELELAKAESDLYIKTLERQKDEMRNDLLKKNEDLNARTNLEDLIERLNSQPSLSPQSPRDNTEKPAINPDEIELRILKTIENNKLKEIENANLLQVQNKLKDRFGQHTSEILKEQADTLGLSEKDVNDLAKKSPEAFFRMLGLDQAKDTTNIAPPRNERRNDSFVPKSQKRTWTWYQDLKTKNPNEYWSPKTQLQMHKDAETLGSTFEDGDF